MINIFFSATDKLSSGLTDAAETHLPHLLFLEGVHPLLQCVFALTSGKFIDRLFHLHDNKKPRHWTLSRETLQEPSQVS